LEEKQGIGFFHCYERNSGKKEKAKRQKKAGKQETELKTSKKQEKQHGWWQRVY